MTQGPEDTTRGPGGAELEERARAGDLAAREELLVRARGPLVAFCFRYLGDLHGAEDTCQDVLTRLSTTSWPTGSFRAWAFRVARNRCLDQLRQRDDGRRGASSSFNSARLPSPRTGPFTAVDREEQHDHLRQHLAELTSDQAEVILLAYFDGLCRKEIADVLEHSESVVKSRLFEAVKELRRRTGGSL